MLENIHQLREKWEEVINPGIGEVPPEINPRWRKRRWQLWKYEEAVKAALEEEERIHRRGEGIVEREIDRGNRASRDQN